MGEQSERDSVGRALTGTVRQRSDRWVDRAGPSGGKAGRGAGERSGKVGRRGDRRTAGRRFRGLLEAAPDAMVILDDAGTILLVNAQTESLFGHSRAELLGRPVEMLVPERYRARHSAHRLGYADNRQVRPMGAGLDLFGLRKDGTEFPVEVSLSPLETADGVLISAAVRDVSDRKRAQRELTELYEQQRHVALTLQRSLMGTPADVPRIRTVDRYLPVTQGAGVGGDWFDLIPLPDGRVGVLIGDVMGRGLEAATVMGQLRSAAHALAMTGMPARELMQALDTFTTGLPDQLVTCCYLIVDPDTGELSVCSAGHLPILAIDPEGDVRRLPVPVSVPLGVGGVPHTQVGLRVPAGSTLVLYTDGLVETPGSDIELQIDKMATALREAFADRPDLPSAMIGDARWEELADRLCEVMLPGVAEPSDDVTLLLVQIPVAARDAAEI